MNYEDLNDCQKKAYDKHKNNLDQRYEYQDNFRLAIVGNTASETEYYKLQEKGCCGFYDTKIPCKDGSILLFGFNYGH